MTSTYFRLGELLRDSVKLLPRYRSTEKVVISAVIQDGAEVILSVIVHRNHFQCRLCLMCLRRCLVSVVGLISGEPGRKS